MIESGIPTSAAVLEDEAWTLGNMQEDLKGVTTEVHCAQTYKAFLGVIDSTRFDAVSLDLWIGSFNKGTEAIEYSASKQPDSAKVIYTQHHISLSQRVLEKVDWVLSKDRPEEYGPTMEKAVALGRARRVFRQLEKHGERDLPMFPRARQVSEDHLESLCERAKDVSLKLLLRGERDDGLTELLVGAGWWRHFDPCEYVVSPLSNKVALLLSFADVNAEDLSRMLNIEVREAQELLSGTQEPLGRSEIVDQLLSVLAYLLRLADYNPELMESFWLTTEVFHRSLIPPPWDKMGMADYLRTEGSVGIKNSLMWIRRSSSL